MVMTPQVPQMGNYRIHSAAEAALTTAAGYGPEGSPSDDAPIPAPSGWAALATQPAAPAAPAVA
jgi:hypothetical protein